MSAPIRTYRIAAIPGDGIGIEVVAAAPEVGTAYFKESGLYLPKDFPKTLKGYDAILFGAVGAAGKPTGKPTKAPSCDPPTFLTTFLSDVPDHESLWGLLLKIRAEFPGVTWDRELVDAMTIRMVQKPASIDTVVGTNLHIDILSDLAAALAGSIGIASSANLDPTRAYPSMFEPVHGSAFDITRKGIANPIGAIWAAADMLAWLGEGESANSIMEAISTACDRKMLTADMGGTLNTVQATEEICKALF
ncbi:hypothetical protein V502_07413 [Pseudogymnoascus sp. VKM F-4520 (FW-2644)]|nr:hypothetical protein V502_07413 [Pseudogymnoascus sp. VKM F-4520 (FW-2644)]